MVSRIGLGFAVAAVVLIAGCTGGVSGKESVQPSATEAPMASVSAETGSLDATVVDEEAMPIAGAEVAILDANVKAKSDAAGHVVFNDLAPGSYKVFAQRLGFEGAARTVAVEAGAVAKVTFTLKAISISNESYYVMTPFDGFMQCSFGTFSPLNPCGGITGEDKTSWIVDVLRPAPLKEVVIELVWTQTSSATGDEMESEWCDDIEHRNVLCANNQVGGYWRYADGKSPVVMRITDTPQTAKQMLLGAGSKTLGKPVIQQKFTDYLTFCYVEKCPEDYQARPPDA